MHRLSTVLHPKVGTSQPNTDNSKIKRGSHRPSPLHVVTEFQHTEFVKIPTTIHRKYDQIRNRVNTEVLEWAVATMAKLSGE